MKLDARSEAFPLANPFVISGRGTGTPWVRTEARVLTVTVEGDGILGRGECTPYPRYDETVEKSTEEVRAIAAMLGDGLDRQLLLSEMRPGAARNAVDAALWDREAKAAGRRVWELAGLPAPRPVETAYTLSLAEPGAMRATAAGNAWRPLLKVKLGGEGDMARLEAVREGAPASRIIVDANEGWSVEEYQALAPHLLRLGVAMVEQPLPAGADAALEGIDRPLPVCADESCHDRASLPALRGKYDMVNIKLDKTGGLTEALALREAALAEGYAIMVGCMMGSSLAMAPAHLVAQGANIVDLDAPLLLAADRDPPIRYEGAMMQPPDPALWG